MNLKEKLAGYKRNEKLLAVSGHFGMVKEVGNDYVVFQEIVWETREHFFSDSEYEIIGINEYVMPFVKLEIIEHDNQEFITKMKKALSKYRVNH